MGMWREDPVGDGREEGQAAVTELSLPNTHLQLNSVSTNLAPLQNGPPAIPQMHPGPF